MVRLCSRSLVIGALTVVIVNWNGAHLLDDCLSPLKDSGHEVILVDNGSQDGSVVLVGEQHPWVTVMANPDNRGFAVANNQGIKACATPFVLLLNNDTIPDPAALDQLVDFMSADPSVGIAGPTLVNLDGSPQLSCGPGPNLWTEFIGKTMLHRLLPDLRALAPSKTMPVDWVTGAALCIRMDLAQQLSGLDEQMFMFYEDLDLCARARAAGSQVWFVRTPPIVHLGGATRKFVEAKSLVHSYDSTQRFFAQNGSTWEARLVRLMTIPELCLRAALWTILGIRPSRRALARERLSAYAQILGKVLRGQ